VSEVQQFCPPAPTCRLIVNCSRTYKPTPVRQAYSTQPIVNPARAGAPTYCTGSVWLPPIALALPGSHLLHWLSLAPTYCTGSAWLLPIALHCAGTGLHWAALDLQPFCSAVQCIAMQAIACPVQPSGWEPARASTVWIILVCPVRGLGEGYKSRPQGALSVALYLWGSEVQQHQVEPNRPKERTTDLSTGFPCPSPLFVLVVLPRRRFE